MLRGRAIIRSAAAHIAEAARATASDYARRLIEDEEMFTDRMLGRIAHAMDGYRNKGVIWEAKTLTAHQSNSQETRFGADFIGALEINLPESKVKKGFLAQAKRIEPEDYMSPGEFRRMVGQCEKMLRLTPASFVFLYGRAGISVLPATAVAHSTSCNPHELYTLDIARFYEQHFECFFGDTAVYAASIEPLEELLRQREVINLHLLRLKAQEEQISLLAGLE